jgi:hypothetical protein
VHRHALPRVEDDHNQGLEVDRRVIVTYQSPRLKSRHPYLQPNFARLPLVRRMRCDGCDGLSI